jgi:hypothetical protein
MTLILSGTDGLSDVDGSAATPAIRGTDANTGIFFPAADTIAFSEGGAEAMRIDSSGNVGIGTASPTDTSSFTRALDLNGTSGAGYYARTNSSATNYTLFGNFGSDGYINNRGSGSFIVFNNGSERMRIDSSGNVGIGTSSPIGKLTVSNAGAEGIEFIPGNVSNVSTTQYYNRSGAAYTANAQNASYHSWLISGTERARIDTSGNLLVGVATTITSKYTATVSTSATTISSFASDYGQMVIVSGNSGGNIFSDLLFSCTTAGPTVLSSKTISGAPVARTYTMSAQNLRLAMASGTYEVWCAQYVGK